jgi:hypothetical protein
MAEPFSRRGVPVLFDIGEQGDANGSGASALLALADFVELAQEIGIELEADRSVFDFWQLKNL